MGYNLSYYSVSSNCFADSDIWFTLGFGFVLSGRATEEMEKKKELISLYYYTNTRICNNDEMTCSSSPIRSISLISKPLFGAIASLVFITPNKSD